VKAVLRELKADLRSSEVLDLIAQISLQNLPWSSAESAESWYIGSNLALYRCCLLMISFQEGETLLAGIVSKESSSIALSLLEAIQDWRRAQCPDFWYNGIVRRNLWLAGLALTPEGFPQGIHCVIDIKFLYSSRGKMDYNST
jgi:hypothetical protein